jgi:cell cycle checkpoint control protein RAD9A
LTISADEFENYDIFATPISFAFHLREFNVSLRVSLAAAVIVWYVLTYDIDKATIAYAESMEAILEVRFTDPAAALYVNVQSDSIESLFAVSTNRVPGAPDPPAAAVPSQARSAGSSESAQVRAGYKRPREETMARHRTPAKVVERVAPAAFTRRSPGVRLPTPSHPRAVCRPSLANRPPREEHLFLPGSQMSAADKEALQASGLGDMDADEFKAMIEDEGEEVGFNLYPSDVPAPLVPPTPPPPPLSPTPDLDLDEQGHGQDAASFEDDIEFEMGPTQSDESGKVCPLTPPFVLAFN